MVEEIKTYRCTTCGKNFEEKGHADTCEELHVAVSDLKIEGAVGIMGEGRAYSSGTRLPEVLLVKSDKLDAKAYYRLFRRPEALDITHVPAEKGRLKLEGE